MRVTSFGIGKVKAVQCYLSLLIWLILVSIGLYWFLNRNGSGGLSSVLTQSGLGYHDGVSYQDSSETDSNNGRIRDTKSIEGQHHNDLEATVEDRKDGDNELKFKNSNRKSRGGKQKGFRDDSINRICNPVESIKAEDENVQVPDFKLEAIIVLFRHGDRGPLTHIGNRNVSHINCASKTPDFEQLSKFATETLMKLPGYSQFIGPFHSFSKVPSSQYCSLGQLSQQGSAQLLALGKMIRSTYKTTLTNLTTFAGTHETHPLKVVAFSTRYRRTFQSLFAFLFGLLGPKQLIQSTTIHESQSITFCFKHCSCKAADKLKKTATKLIQFNPNEKEKMNKLVSQLNLVLGTDKSKKTGNSLLDSLLVYPCHKMELPCQQDIAKEGGGVRLMFKTLKNLSLYNHQVASDLDLSCITLENLKNLIELINIENLELKKIPENHHYHLLSSYGLLKEIVNIALKMTSTTTHTGSPEFTRKHQTAAFPPSSFSSSSLNNPNRNLFWGTGSPKPRNSKIVIFSGHDTTLQSLTAALGILSGHPDINLPPFSSRLIFEFYRRTSVSLNSPRKLYFRVIYNGIAVTHLITFCKEGFATSNNTNTNNSSSSSGDMHKTANKEGTRTRKNNYYNKTLFCPIENLVRFIHDHYFDSFRNATNFKDACQPN